MCKNPVPIFYGIEEVTANKRVQGKQNILSTDVSESRGDDLAVSVVSTTDKANPQCTIFDANVEEKQGDV